MHLIATNEFQSLIEKPENQFSHLCLLQLAMIWKVFSLKFMSPLHAERIKIKRFAHAESSERFSIVCR